MRPRKPLLAGEAFVPVAAVARAAGVDEATLRALVESGRLAGLIDGQGRATGILESALPGAEELARLGLAASPDYEPRSLCTSYVDPATGPDEPSPGRAPRGLLDDVLVRAARA